MTKAMSALAPFTSLRSLRSGVFALAGLVFALCAAPAQAQTDLLAHADKMGAAVRLHGDQAQGGEFTVAVVSWRDIPFRTVVRQQYDYSCGSAAIATLLRFHYGVDVREAQVFQAMYAVGDQAHIRQVGFSMLDMKRYLERRGFQADGLRLSLDRLANLNLPAIALVTRGSYRHFVVVKGIRNGRVLVGDPTFGLQTYSRADFETIWNGVVLAVRHAPDGAQTPAFNRDEEWRPWAVAPIGDAQGPADPAQVLFGMPELYQVAPVRVIP